MGIESGVLGVSWVLSLGAVSGGLGAVAGGYQRFLWALGGFSGGGRYLVDSTSAHPTLPRYTPSPHPPPSTPPFHLFTPPAHGSTGEVGEGRAQCPGYRSPLPAHHPLSHPLAALLGTLRPPRAKAGVERWAPGLKPDPLCSQPQGLGVGARPHEPRSQLGCLPAARGGGGGDAPRGV